MDWIKVEDQLPPIEKRVLVYQKGGVFGGNEVDITYRTCEYYSDDKEINNAIAWDGQGIGNYIHHWMPLPSPPKE